MKLTYKDYLQIGVSLIMAQYQQRTSQTVMKSTGKIITTLRNITTTVDSRIMTNQQYLNMLNIRTIQLTQDCLMK